MSDLRSSCFPYHITSTSLTPNVRHSQFESVYSQSPYLLTSLSLRFFLPSRQKQLWLSTSLPSPFYLVTFVVCSRVLKNVLVCPLFWIVILLAFEITQKSLELVVTIVKQRLSSVDFSEAHPETLAERWNLKHEGEMKARDEVKDVWLDKLTANLRFHWQKN